MAGKVITVMNMKGGVGKTTVSLLLALYDAIYHKSRVLLIDYDPQFNASQSLLKPAVYSGLVSAGKTSLAILRDPSDQNPFQIQGAPSDTPPSVTALAVQAWTYKDIGSLWLVPSSLELMYLVVGETASLLPSADHRFAKFVTEAKNMYDRVYIDCHPAGSILTKTALSNSSDLVVPVISGPYSNRGLGLIIQFLNHLENIGRTKPTMHVLFNMVPRSGYNQNARHEGAIRADAQLGPLCLTNMLHTYAAFARTASGEHVYFSRSPWSNQAYANIRAVAQELKRRIP